MAQRTREGWVWLAGGLVVGYVTMNRSFAYLGLPAANLFVGEIALVTVLVFRQDWLARSFRATIVAEGREGFLGWAAVAFGVSGLLSLAYGLWQGHAWLTSLKGTAFFYYAAFMFVGLAIGRERPRFLARLLYFLAWANGVYGTAYILWLGQLTLRMPGADQVMLFGTPVGSAVSLLGLVAFDSARKDRWLLLVLNAFVLLGVQLRAEWLALMVGLSVWVFVSRRIDKAADCLGIVALLLIVGAVTDFRFPSPQGRGGEFAIREIFARAVAVVSTDVAAGLSSHAQFYRDTTSWRLVWWQAILSTVISAEHPIRMLLGLGLGFPLYSLVDYVDSTVRSPHNIALYALAYSGFVGLAAFVALQFAIVTRFQQALRWSNEARFGVSCWASLLTIALFSNFLEAPFGGIPFHLLMGLAIGAVRTDALARSSRISAPRSAEGHPRPGRNPDRGEPGGTLG